MSGDLDPYHRWLGIPPEEQPANRYRLLGLVKFESDPEVIRDGAERQMAHVRRYGLGKHAEISQRILNELAGARACLLEPGKKAAYDTRLRAKLAAKSAPSRVAASPAPPPVQTSSTASHTPGSVDKYSLVADAVTASALPHKAVAGAADMAPERTSASAFGKPPLLLVGVTMCVVIGGLIAWAAVQTRSPKPLLCLAPVARKDRRSRRRIAASDSHAGAKSMGGEGPLQSGSRGAGRGRH